MKETRMPPVQATNLVANSGNTIYRVSVIVNGACHPGGHYYDYSPGTQSFSQVTATHLTELLWNLQICNLIVSLDWKLEKREFPQDFNYELVYLWNPWILGLNILTTPPGPSDIYRSGPGCNFNPLGAKSSRENINIYLHFFVISPH